MNPKAEISQETNTRPGFNVIGLVGFVVCAVSAAFSIAAILMWKHYATKNLDFEGGRAFEMNIIPLVVSWAGIGIGVPGLLVTALSIAMGWMRNRCRVDFIEILSGVLLAPAAYLLFKMYSR